MSIDIPDAASSLERCPVGGGFGAAPPEFPANWECFLRARAAATAKLAQPAEAPSLCPDRLRTHDRPGRRLLIWP